MKKQINILSLLCGCLCSIQAQVYKPQTSFYADPEPLTIEQVDSLYQQYLEDQTTRIIYYDFIGYKHEHRCANAADTVPAAIFKQFTSAILFPPAAQLNYPSSSKMRMDELAYMEGVDVIDNLSLVDRNKTLIAAATKQILSYKVPNGVVRIGSGALRGVSLLMADLPESVQEIDDYAFADAYIERLYIRTTRFPKISNLAFGPVTEDHISLYVPKKLVKKYKKMFPGIKQYIYPIEDK